MSSGVMSRKFVEYLKRHSDQTRVAGASRNPGFFNALDSAFAGMMQCDFICGSRNRETRIAETMRLHQIKIEFLAVQDRLLLSVSTDDGKEVLLYLTRRYVRRLWPVLIDMARSSPEVAMQGSPEARAALLEYQHDQAVRQSIFSRPYEELSRSWRRASRRGRTAAETMCSLCCRSMGRA
jgi:hypothetical protein